MDKKSLITRWDTTDVEIRNELIRAIRGAGLLDQVSGLKKTDGRWDLRGFKVPAPARTENIRSYLKVEGAFAFTGMVIDNSDLSYADLSFTTWRDCKIGNSIFVEAKLKDVFMAASDIVNTEFINTDFKDSFIGQNVGKNSGSFINVTFNECNLSNVGFCFPKIEGTNFKNCDLKDTDFDGSRFANCKFTGLLDSTFFRGYSKDAHTSFLWVFNRVRPRNFFNEMYGVDFSEASLSGISFTNHIDLSRCILPRDGSAILVTDLKNTYDLMKIRINNEWSGEYKRIGLEYIDSIYYNKDRQDQPNDIIDIDTLSQGTGMEKFGQDFFNLLKNVKNESVNHNG
ncbi:MAG TPA: pentapeptide repeat-containing protein [Cyclobacteriaceae bacterium]|nr:pentapeptide repeat-containing protein [Cyclobacteriaceae bacterium]